MTRTQFIINIKKEVDEFNRYWVSMQEKELNNYPEKFESAGDWDEQFMYWLQTRKNETH